VTSPLADRVIETLGAGRTWAPLGLPAFQKALEAARGAVGASFAPQRLELVASVSEAILKGGVRSRLPGVVHFAYWTRKAALKKLAGDHQARLPEGCLARPRGVVFHLPPQNVETVFLYSWVISYLAGNANLTRLPTELSDDMAGLLDLFLTALAKAGDNSQLFVRYPVDPQVNTALSAASDARVVWGGDAKIEAFAALPLRGGGKPIWFGDRRSLALIKAEAVAALSREERRDLANRLHNDVFVFNQLACSSPQWMYVIGEDDGAAVEALMDDLSDIAIERGSVPPTSHVIQKMVASMARAGAGGVTTVARRSNALTTILAERTEGAPTTGGGLLTLSRAEGFEPVWASLGENIQTIVHFGFSQEELAAFAEGLPPLAVTRIVPAGAALDFDAIWDGYDLFSELTRLLRVSMK
jgi:hypothetical protein